jgi:hypothetical protein
VGEPSSVRTAVVDEGDAQACLSSTKPRDTIESRPRGQQSISDNQLASGLLQNSFRLMPIRCNKRLDRQTLKPTCKHTLYFVVDAQEDDLGHLFALDLSFLAL